MIMIVRYVLATTKVTRLGRHPLGLIQSLSGSVIDCGRGCLSRDRYELLPNLGILIQSRFFWFFLSQVGKYYFALEAFENVVLPLLRPSKAVKLHVVDEVCEAVT